MGFIVAVVIHIPIFFSRYVHAGSAINCVKDFYLHSQCFIHLRPPSPDSTIYMEQRSSRPGDSYFLRQCYENLYLPVARKILDSRTVRFALHSPYWIRSIASCNYRINSVISQRRSHLLPSGA